jgi:hypothetical protein
VAPVSFDTAVLIALERNDQRAWAWMKRAAERGEPPIVATAAVAEAERGQDAADVVPDGSDAEDEAFGDLAVGQAGREELEDLVLRLVRVPYRRGPPPSRRTSSVASSASRVAPRRSKAASASLASPSASSRRVWASAWAIGPGWAP